MMNANSHFGTLKYSLITLLVLIFADFAVLDKVRENLYPRKGLF